jgi:hypothetical protein
LVSEDDKKAQRASSIPDNNAKFLRNVVILVAAISLSFGLMTVAIFEDKYSLLVLSDLAINIGAAASLILASVIVQRQKLGGLHGKTYAAFAIGLALWFAAEIIQTYYEIGTEEEVPYPSIADALWLAGYGPFGYHLFATYRFFNKSAKPHSLVIVIATTAAIFGSFVPITVLSSSLVTENLVELVVNVMYPALDAILIVPAIMMFSILRKGKLAAIPWVLLSASLLIIAAADSAFGYIAATSPDSEIWGFSAFYFAGYLCMAGALYCHNRFFVFSKARSVKLWQEQNR